MDEIEARIYAAIVKMHDRGVDCGDLLGSRTLASELAKAARHKPDGGD